jgi:glycosyltransferase involved in cell wall biosynthesis
VLLEAAAAGTAIVATAAGGTTDLVRDGETGLIVRAGDSEELRRALEKLATDDGLRHRLAAAARRAVCERFDWGIIADVLECELSGLRNRARGPSVATARRVRFDRCRHSFGR